MFIKILIGVGLFVSGYYTCVLMTSSTIDSRIDEIREDYREELARQIKKVEAALKSNDTTGRTRL